MMTNDEIHNSVEAMALRDANHYDFEMAWQSIYNTFEDNAFDYRGKPLEVGGALIMWQGGRWAEYVEVPF